MVADMLAGLGYHNWADKWADRLPLEWTDILAVVLHLEL